MEVRATVVDLANLAGRGLVLVQQALGRLGALDDDRAGIAAQPLLVVCRKLASGVDDHRREGADVLLGHAPQQLVALHVGQLEVDDHAVELGFAQPRQGLVVVEAVSGFGALRLDHVVAALPGPQRGGGDAGQLGGALEVHRQPVAARVFGNRGL